MSSVAVVVGMLVQDYYIMCTYPMMHLVTFYWAGQVEILENDEFQIF